MATREVDHLGRPLTDRGTKTEDEYDDESNHEARMLAPGHIDKVGPTAGALRGRGRPSSVLESCRPWSDFWRTTGDPRP